MMTASKRRYFSGNSIEQAVMAAACHYHVDPDRIAYERVEKRHGFLRVRRRVVIEVDPDNLLLPEGAVSKAAGGEAGAARPVPPAQPSSRPRAEEPLPAPAHHPRPEEPRERRRHRDQEPEPRRPVEIAPPRTRAILTHSIDSEEDLLEAAKEALKPILGLAKLELEAEVELVDDRLEVDLTGPDRRRLLAEEGEVLEAIEYLLPRVMRRVAGESMGVRVDSGNYRQGREDELRSLALRAAETARQRGRPVTLETMNPAERRIVHLALADVEDVVTESEGDGYFKRVVVREV